MNAYHHLRVSIPILAGLLLTMVARPVCGQDWRTVRQLPGVDMRGLDADQREVVLQILREEDCPCGCKMKLAECRINDEACPLSPKLAKLATDAARAGHPSIVIRSAVVAQVPADDLNGPVTFEAIRGMALAGELPEPYFSFPEQRNQGTMRYGFGAPRDGRGGPVEIEYRNPTRIVVELQMTVEALRKYRRNDFWAPYLRQVEATVKTQIDWLNTDREPDDPELLKQLLAHAAYGYSILDGAVQKVARDNGWRLEGPNFAPKAAPKFSFVNVSVQPNGASVYFVPEPAFRAMAKLGLKAVRDVDGNWVELLDLGENMQISHAGKIRFYAVWPNGRENMKLVNVTESDLRKRPIINRIAIGGR